MARAGQAEAMGKIVNFSPAIVPGKGSKEMGKIHSLFKRDLGITGILITVWTNCNRKDVM